MENKPDILDIAKKALFFELTHNCPEFVLVYSEDPKELWIEAWFFIPQWNEYRLLDFTESKKWLGNLKKIVIGSPNNKNGNYNAKYYIFYLYGVPTAARPIKETEAMPAEALHFEC